LTFQSATLSRVVGEKDVRKRKWIKLIEALERATSFFGQAEGDVIGEQPQILSRRYHQIEILFLVRFKHTSVTTNLSKKHKRCASFSARNYLADNKFASVAAGCNPVRCPVHIDGPDLTNLWKHLKLPLNGSLSGIYQMRENRTCVILGSPVPNFKCTTADRHQGMYVLRQPPFLLL